MLVHNFTSVIFDGEFCTTWFYYTEILFCLKKNKKKTKIDTGMQQVYTFSYQLNLMHPTFIQHYNQKVFRSIIDTIIYIYYTCVYKMHFSPQILVSISGYVLYMILKCIPIYVKSKMSLNWVKFILNVNISAILFIEIIAAMSTHTWKLWIYHSCQGT